MQRCREPGRLHKGKGALVTLVLSSTRQTPAPTDVKLRIAPSFRAPSPGREFLLFQSANLEARDGSLSRPPINELR